MKMEKCLMLVITRCRTGSGPAMACVCSVATLPCEAGRPAARGVPSRRVRSTEFAFTSATSIEL
jgi:hypothetical protein